ncbi:MAG: NnrU family protein [Rhizobium sp.]|nr:NnrU family protein [Rhizobium sp.]
MTLLILGIILFIGTHMVRIVAPGFRRAMIEKLGESGWKAGHGIASTISLVVLILGWRQAPVVDLWFPPTGMTHLTLTLMLIAMICLAAGVLPAGHIATRTKHPMVLSVKIWALAHLLSNGDLASVLLFGSFLAWGVIARISLKRRQRAGEVVLRPFVSAKWDLVAVVLGLAVYGLFVWKLHALLIGVAPLPM